MKIKNQNKPIPYDLIGTAFALMTPKVFAQLLQDMLGISQLAN